MRKTTICLGIVSVLLAFSCDKTEELINDPIVSLPNPEIPGTQPEPTPQLPTLGSPVETTAPNTTYSPAFEGQTRVGSISTTTPLQIQVIASNLVSPWGIVNLPDQRLLITSKTGSMRIYNTSGVLEKTITGFSNIASSGQGGLLDVAIDPDFSTNKIIYFTFSESVAGGNHTSLAKGVLSTNESVLENIEVIFRATPSYNGSLHFGSRIVFDDFGYIYMSTGERSDTNMRQQAQNKASGLGKIFKLDKNGLPAPNNPFIGQNNVMEQIYSLGHRNPQGLAIHPVTKELWQSEMGTRGGDEINRIEIGKNYGWPVITYGLEYSGSAIGAGIQQQTGMEQPIYYWDPSVSPSGIDFYTGNLIPEWKNNLFVGALSGKHIIRLHIHNNKIYGEERLLANQNERFRDVLASHPDGSVYAITDSGKLYKISNQ